MEQAITISEIELKLKTKVLNDKGAANEND